MPVAEFAYLCDVFDMLRDGVPEGLEGWFERPMRSLDVLMMCQMHPGRAAPACTPSLVASSKDIVKFCMLGYEDETGRPASAQRPSRMIFCDDHFMIQLPASFVWHSRLKTTTRNQ